LLQYDANDVLVQRDTIRLLKGADKFHSNIVGTAPYDPLLPLAGWVAPSGPITGNTVEVKFTDGTVANYTYDGTVWVLDFDVTPIPETTGTITISDEDGNNFVQDNNANAVFTLHRTIHANQGLVVNKIGVSSEDSDQTSTGNITTNHTNVVKASTLSSCAGSNNTVIASNDYSEIYGGSENFIAANRTGWLLATDTKCATIASQNALSAGNNRWSAHIGGAYNTWSNFRYSLISGQSNTYNNVTDGSLVSGFANAQNAGQIQSASIFCRYTKFNASVGGSLILGGGIASRENEINGSITGSIFIGATDVLATFPTKVENVDGSIIQVKDSRHIGSFQQGILNAHKSEINSPASLYSLIQLSNSNISGSNYSAFVFGENITSSGNINQSSVIGRDHTVNSNIFTSFISGANTSINHSGVFVYNNTSSVLTTDNVSKGFLGFINGMDIYSNNALSLGVTLAPNGTSWASISDVNKKTDFKKLDYSGIYERFKNIEIQTWKYKDADTKHVGITAQDFYKTLGENVGSDNLKIETIDADGLTLALIKALQAEIENLKSVINSLKSKK
jgi:hypothetical protein